MKIQKLKESYLKEDTSKEWKPNTSFKHIKDIYNKVKENNYKYVNNEREEFMAAVKKADNKGYKPEECRQIKDWHREIWQKNKKNEDIDYSQFKDIPDLIPYTPVKDTRKWQYSVGGVDVPYTSYEEAKAHLKDDYKITNYRDELQKYIDKETGRPHTFFVDETFDGRLCIDINYGDWKHEHWYADSLVKKFFMDKGLGVEIEEDVTLETGSDTYSACHYYEIDDIMLSGRVVEDLTESNIVMPDDAEYERIDRSGTDDERLVAAVSYMFGVDMNKAKEYIPDLSDTQRKKALTYYDLRNLPQDVRIAKIKELYPKHELQSKKDESLNESSNYKVKFFQVFEAPKSPKENGKMVGQRETLKDAIAFGDKRTGGRNNFLVKAVCNDGTKKYVDFNHMSDDEINNLSEALNENAFTDAMKIAGSVFKNTGKAIGNSVKNSALGQAVSDKIQAVKDSDLVKNIKDDVKKTDTYKKHANKDTVNKVKTSYNTYLKSVKSAPELFFNCLQLQNKAQDINQLGIFQELSKELENVAKKNKINLLDTTNTIRQKINDKSISNITSKTDIQKFLTDTAYRNSVLNQWNKVYSKKFGTNAVTESIDNYDNVQYGVHQYSTDSIIFRGTEEECGKYIDNRKELWDDAEIYMMTPDDPHYKKDLNEASKGFEKEFYNNFVILKNRGGDGWDIYSYDGTPEKVTRAYLEDEGYATLQAAKDEIDKWHEEAKLDESIKEDIEYKGYTICQKENDAELYIKKDGKFIKDKSGNDLQINWMNDAKKYIDNLTECKSIKEEHDILSANELADKVFTALNNCNISGYGNYIDRADDSVQLYPKDKSIFEEITDCLKSDFVFEINRYGHIIVTDLKSLSESTKPDKKDLDENLLEASYGGAFDIADDQYFTREDIEEASEKVLDHINETFSDGYVLGGTWFENGKWIVNVQTQDGMEEYETEVPVDMRKVKQPRDIQKYALEVAGKLISQIKEYNGLEEAFSGEYSDKFYSLAKDFEADDDVQGLRVLADDIIRYCPEEDVKDCWYDRGYQKRQDDEEDRIAWLNSDDGLNEDYDGESEKGPKQGADAGIADLLSSAIIDEWEAIKEYNDLAINARAEGFDDVATIIDDINTEENIHVGQLQQALTTISPNATVINQGQQEARDQLTGGSAAEIDSTTELDDVDDEF